MPRSTSAPPISQYDVVAPTCVKTAVPASRMQQPDHHHPAAAVAVRRAAAEVHPERRAQALRGHQQAGHQRRFAAGDLVVERQQDHRAEEGDSGEEHRGRRRPRTRPRGTGARRGADSATRKRVHHERGDGEQAEHERQPARWEPRGCGASRTREMPKTIAPAPGDTSASPRQSSRESLASRPPRPARGRGPRAVAGAASSRPTIPTGRFTKKIQRQRQVLDDRAADHRAEHRRQQHRHARRCSSRGPCDRGPRPARG